jgi:hypothetical protein
MKKQIAAACQISVYSESKAEEIASRLCNTITDSGKPCNPIVEDWTGDDTSWPPEPEVYIFFCIQEECDVDNRGIPVKILNAITDENVSLRMEEDFLLEAKRPESIEQHFEWVGVTINEYQSIYANRKFHPDAEQYKRNVPKWEKWNT